jgi:hypothetical protein
MLHSLVLRTLLIGVSALAVVGAASLVPASVTEAAAGVLVPTELPSETVGASASSDAPATLDSAGLAWFEWWGIGLGQPVTATFDSTWNSGSIYSESTSYRVARRGGSRLARLPDARVGQRIYDQTYQCFQTFLEFDLSSIAGATIDSATLTIYDIANDTQTDFAITVARYDYGGSVARRDFRTASQLRALTPRAARWTRGIHDRRDVVLSGAALTSILTPGARNRIIIFSSRQAARKTPHVNEYITTYATDAKHPPILTVTYTPAAS